jgi:abnormal spindle-like microcephaly-associated protein
MTRNKLVGLHEAATTIQAVWRGHVQLIDFVISYGNIIIAQSFVRRFLAAKRALTRHAGLIKIQSICRRYLGIRRCQLLREKRRFEHRQNHAAKIIQSLYRGALVRQDIWWKNSAATLIQAQYRGRMVRVFYELELYDITTVQAIARRWLASRLSERKANSVLVIQSVVRAWMARCTVSQVWAERQREIARIKAITRVQNSYRGYLVRRNIGALHGMAILIQKAFRGHYSYVAHKMLVVDVTIVQSQARLWLVKGWLSKANMSAVKIQSLGRRRFAARQASVLRTEKALSEIQNLFALTLQRIWRGRVSRKISSTHSSARKIQKTWRCFTAHVEYLVQQISIIRLQSSIRKMCAVEKYNKTRFGIVRFQAAFRGYSTREYIRFISLSTIVVQAAFRKYAARKAYLQHIRGITHLQAIVRGVRVRDELEFWNFAACEIQRIWRGFTQFCDYVIVVDATVELQAFFRKTIAIRRFKELRLVLHVERSYYNHVTRSIQRSFRSYLHRKHLAEAAGVIQRRARFYIQMRRATIVDRGVRRVQAIWRAKIVRRLRSKKLSALVLRLDVANRKARNDPKLRIGYKTRHALEVLQNSKSLAGIMDAVKSLETSTRLSQLCCVLFTEAHAARILLDLIRSCNRSIPHMELVQCILLTLDNVSEYRALVPSFADCNSAEIFLDKMQMFRDKDGIFCLSISLLERISDCNPMVEEFCAMHEHLKRLKALHQLSLRRSITSTFSTKRNIKVNRMKRRENFDRNIAVKALGLMTEKFDARSLAATTVAPHSREHFTFKDSQHEH